MMMKVVNRRDDESCQPSADRGRRGAQVERKVGRDTDDALEHTRDMPDEIHQS